jgi:hypothetical protein
LVLRYHIVSTKLKLEVTICLLGMNNLLAVSRVLSRVHGLLLLELFNLLFSKLSLQLSFLTLLLTFGLVLLDSLLLGCGLSLVQSTRGGLGCVIFVVATFVFLIGGFITTVSSFLSFLSMISTIIVLAAHKHLALEHLLECLDRLLKELRHLVHAEGSHIGSGLECLHSELLELEHIVELLLQLVQAHCRKLNAPGYLLLRFFNLVEVSFTKHIEIYWIDIEVLL